MSPASLNNHGAWKIQKRSWEIDRWLDEMGYFRKHIARDASCLFRAVSEHIYNTQHYFQKVREDCISFIASNKRMFEGSLKCQFETYLKEMANPSEYGGTLEISAMSHLYRRDFIVFDANKGPQIKICSAYGNEILLFHIPEAKHFDVIYTKEYITNTAFCQSLVYEMLYEQVFQLKDLFPAVEKMLHKSSSGSSAYMLDSEDRHRKQKDLAKILFEADNSEAKSLDESSKDTAITMKCKHLGGMGDAGQMKESLSIFVLNRSLIQLENVCLLCLNVSSAKDLLKHSIIPFPYKVAKALDPDIYRNIEFDVWREMRREIRFGSRYSDGKTLQVGVKCLCKLQPDQTVPYHCHIQEMHPGGPCLVFIEELGEKRIVHYDQLQLLPKEEIRPWAPPYRHSRSQAHVMSLTQILQQIGSVTRKAKPRNKTKSISEDCKKVKEDKVDSCSLDLNQTKISTKLHDLPFEDCIQQAEMPISGESNTAEMSINLSAYHNMDCFTLPFTVKVTALPLMVDYRCAGAGAGMGASVTEGVNGEGVVPSVGTGVSAELAPSPGVRASTPAQAPPPPINTYTGSMGGMGAGVGYAPYSMYGGVGSGVGGVKGVGVGGVVWCAPPPPLHLPPGVNPHVHKSIQPNGADLPMNDIATLRYFFNAGVEWLWAGGCASVGAPPPHALPPPHHAHAHPAPHQLHYAPLPDLAQDMQQNLSLNERPPLNGGHGAGHNGGHSTGHDPAKSGPAKPGADKGVQRGNGQRTPLGPRFKRNNEGNQNKGYNNNMHKGQNNRYTGGMNMGRRNSGDARGAPGAPGMYPGGGAGVPGAPDECVLEGGALVSLPYLPYPPPLYPLPYYPIEPEPGMMGMMSVGGYVGGWEESEGWYYPPAPAPAAHHQYPPPAQHLPPPPAQHHAHQYPPPPAHHHMQPPPQPTPPQPAQQPPAQPAPHHDK